MQFFKIPHIPYKEDTIFGLTFLFSILIPLAFLPILSEGYESIRFFLILVAAGVLSLVFLFKKSASKFVYKPLAILLFIFFILNLISTILSVDIVNSVFGYFGRYTSALLFFYAWIVWTISCSSALKNSETRAKIFFHVFIWVATAASALMIFHAYSIGIYYAVGSGDRPIIPGFFGNQNFTAIFIVGVLPLMLAIWDKSASKVKKWIWFLMLFVLMWGLVVSASRGAMAGLLVAAAVLGIALLVKRFPSHVWKSSILALGIFTILFSVFFSLARSSSISNSLQASDDTIQYRLIVWSHTMDMIKHNPVFGLGPGNFFLGFKEAGINDLPGAERFDDAHNLYLHIAAGTGIPAAIVFLLIILLAFYIGAKQVLKTQSLVMLSACLGLVALAVAVGFNPVSIPNWILLGFLISVLVMHSSTEFPYISSKLLIASKTLISIGLILFGTGFIVSEYFSSYSTVAYGVQNYSKAYRYAQISYYTNPVNTVARVYLAAASIHLQMPENVSKKYIESYINLHSNSSGNQKNGSDLYFMLYKTTQNRDYLTTSLMHLNNSLALEPNSSELEIRAGYTNFQAGLKADAMKHLKYAVILDPKGNNFYTWVLIAQLYKEQGDTDQAVYALQQAQALRPEPLLRFLINRIVKEGDIKNIDIPVQYPAIDII